MKKEIVAKADITVSRMDFIKFLEHHCALAKFMRNLEDRGKYFIKYTSELQPPHWIASGFLWERTPEGREFWDNVNNWWEDLLKSDVPKGCQITYHLQED